MKLLPGAVSPSLVGLRGKEELARMISQPWPDTQLGVAIAGGHVDVVDPVLKEDLEGPAGDVLVDLAQRGSSEEDAGALVPRPAEGRPRYRHATCHDIPVDDPQPQPGIAVGPDGLRRCSWATGDDLYRRYHDSEWGRPVADDRRLFEKLSLEGFMSGLSWLTILRKRENFRAAFANFEPAEVAGFGAADRDRLMQDPGIVRNRAKIAATIDNASRCLELQAEFGSFAAYVWRFEPAERSDPLGQAELTALKFSPEAKAMSKDLLRRGWAFVGPTTVQSFMEAMGLVNHHLDGCAVRNQVLSDRAAFKRPVAPGG